MNGRPQTNFRDPSKPARDIYDIQAVRALAWQIYMDNGGAPIELALEAESLTHESYVSQLRECKVMRSKENSGGWGPNVSSHASSIAAGHITRLVKERQHMMARCMSEAEEHFEAEALRKEAKKAAGDKPAGEGAEPAEGQAAAMPAREPKQAADRPPVKSAAPESGEAVLDRLLAESFAERAKQGHTPMFMAVEDGDRSFEPAADDLRPEPGPSGNTFVNAIAGMDVNSYPEEMRDTMKAVTSMLQDEARKPVRVVMPGHLQRGSVQAS